MNETMIASSQRYIEELIRQADSLGVDRDKYIEDALSALLVLAKISTFEDYDLEEVV